MKKQLFAISLLLLSVKIFPQENISKVNSIGVSIPLILNNSEATFYRLGYPIYPTGKAISYGININYSRTIYKKIYGVVGVGYFKQAFKIIRPFNYDSPFALGYSTESYNYSNIQLYGGLGYRKELNKKISLKSIVTFNWFSSFRQKYVVNKNSKAWQLNHKSTPIGNMVNLTIGAEKKVSPKISIGLDVLLPISTRWNSDTMFYNLGYSNDEPQIARNKFSLGTIISCNYHY